MIAKTYLIAGILSLCAGLAQGDDTFTWDSPHHLYRAINKQNDTYHISDTQITSLADSTARPLFEMGGDSAASVFLPRVHGFWSDDDSQLILVSGRKANSGDLALDCQIIEKDAQTSRFGLKSSGYRPTPAPVEEEASDRLLALFPESKSHTVSGYSLLSCRWTGEKILEIENQLDVSVEDVAHSVHNCRTKWTASLQVTDKGLLTTDLGPIVYATLDPQHQPGAWQTLPVTDQDRLRIAVRLGQIDKVTDLLKKGINPNGYADISLLSIAIGRDDLSMADALLKAGASVNPSVSVPEPPLALAMMTPDSRIFDLIMAAHPSPAHDSSEDAYFDLYSGLGMHSGPLQALDPKMNPKASVALAELERRLSVLKAAGFDINAADDKTGETILITAVKDHAALPILQTLVAVGANPTQRNKAGKSSADLAADEKEIDVLRFLDVDHSHAAFLDDHDIPAGSPFVGSWGRGDDMEGLELKTDGSGVYASMLACNVAWKQSGDVASLELVPMKGNLPNGTTLKGTARVTSDGKKLKLELVKTGSPAWTVELSRTHE